MRTADARFGRVGGAQAAQPAGVLIHSRLPWASRSSRYKRPSSSSPATIRSAKMGEVSAARRSHLLEKRPLKVQEQRPRPCPSGGGEAVDKQLPEHLGHKENGTPDPATVLPRDFPNGGSAPGAVRKAWAGKNGAQDGTGLPVPSDILAMACHEPDEEGTTMGFCAGRRGEGCGVESRRRHPANTGPDQHIILICDQGYPVQPGSSYAAATRPGSRQRPGRGLYRLDRSWPARHRPGDNRLDPLQASCEPE
jgi:hypothetical protein